MKENKLEKRIDKALLTYCRENLLEPEQLTKDDWTEVYQLAGMSDKEITAYREEQKKYAAALDDPLDAYRN